MLGTTGIRRDFILLPGLCPPCGVAEGRRLARRVLAFGYGSFGLRPRVEIRGILRKNKIEGPGSL